MPQGDLPLIESGGRGFIFKEYIDCYEEKKNFRGRTVALLYGFPTVRN